MTNLVETLMPGQRVNLRILTEDYNSYLAKGEVTIINRERKEAKVLFDGEFDLDYTYYPIDLLGVEK